MFLMVQLTIRTDIIGKPTNDGPDLLNTYGVTSL